MAAKNNCLILFLILAVKTVSSDDTYFPCKSYISFSYDDSASLNNVQFKTQMNFIQNIIASFNYPDRLRVEGNFGSEFNWNSGLTISQMQSSLNSAQQTSNKYSLLQQAANLLTSVETLDTLNDPIAALIFISDTSDAALKNADRWFSRLSNIQITFVMMGEFVDSVKLRNFSKNFIYWPDLSQSEPDNWDLLFYKAFGCNAVSSTTTSTTTPSTTTQSTTTPQPTTGTGHFLCYSWISFGIDDSNVLSTQNFVTQRKFISSAIGQINRPERIAALGMYNQPASWNSGMNIQQIQFSVNGVMQAGPYLLRNQFGALAEMLQDIQPTQYPIATIIFISDTSANSLVGADQMFSFLSNVRITFVLLGPNADSTKLTLFSNNFIYWPDFSQPQPDNWDNQKFSAYGC